MKKAPNIECFGNVGNVAMVGKSPTRVQPRTCRAASNQDVRETPEAFFAGLLRPAIAGFLAVPAPPGPAERGARLDALRLVDLD